VSYLALLATALVTLCVSVAARASEPRQIEARWLRWQLDFDTAREGQVADHALVAGMRGRALRSGGPEGSRVALAAERRLDLTRPGAFELWVSPESWRAGVGRDYVQFLSVNAPAGAFFTVERDRAVGEPDEDRLLVGYWGIRQRAEFSLALPLTRGWKPGSWHSLAVSWDATGFAVSIDGGAWVSRAVPVPLAREGFASPQALLVIGSAGPEATRIDSIRVFSRPIHRESGSSPAAPARDGGRAP
jgi:hypothetical protein